MRSPAPMPVSRMCIATTGMQGWTTPAGAALHSAEVSVRSTGSAGSCEPCDKSNQATEHAAPAFRPRRRFRGARSASVCCWSSCRRCSGVLAAPSPASSRRRTRWTVVFWRSFWAAAFLLGFMLLRDGGRGTLKLFRDMGLPGLAVALCFATASTSFVVALAYTTVANILLMQAGVPLIAALIALLLFRRKGRAGDLGGDRRRHLRRRHHGLGILQRPGVADRRRAGAADRSRVFDRHRHHAALRPCAHDAGDLPRHDVRRRASPPRRPRRSPRRERIWRSCSPSARSIWAWASPASPPARG